MNILNELWLLFVALWNTGNRWARIAIAVFIGWPVVMIVVAINYRLAVPYIALLPIIALVASIIIWIDPLIVAVIATLTNGRKLLMALITGITVELLIGVFLTFVPVDNNPNLIAPLLLVVLTLILMSSSRMKSPKVKMGLYVLAFFIALAMFFPKTVEKKVAPAAGKIDEFLSGEVIQKQEPERKQARPIHDEVITLRSGEERKIKIGPYMRFRIYSDSDDIIVRNWAGDIVSDGWKGDNLRDVNFIIKNTGNKDAKVSLFLQSV